MDIHKIRGEDHYQCREVKAERDMLKAKLDDLRARLAAAEADAERWRTVKRLVGNWQDGSNETVTLFIDDATRTAFVSVKDSQYYVEGCGIDSAIDAARGMSDE